MIAEVCPVGGAKGEQLHPLVSSLVDYLWAETIGELEYTPQCTSTEYKDGAGNHGNHMWACPYMCIILLGGESRSSLNVNKEIIG